MKYLLIVLTLLTACASPTQQPSYAETVAAERQTKDDYLRTEPNSPIPKAERADFQGLRYFPVDSTYRVEAEVVRTPLARPFFLPTTTERRARFRQYGVLHFTLGGEAYQLRAYQSADLDGAAGGGLFVPFTDATSGAATYGTGRYLDLPPPDEQASTVTLDFNAAYNPYCAYNDDYSCPVPPPENDLPVAIRAGELSFHD